MSDAGTPAARDEAPAAPDRRRRVRFGAVPRRRHGNFGRSRGVATLKYVLPGIAFAILVLVAVWPRLTFDDDRFRTNLTTVGPVGGARPQVLNPRVQGTDSEARPYQITADLGTHSGGRSGAAAYALVNPKADIVLKDGSWVALVADDGRFESATNRLHLTGGVSLFHDGGYEFRTASALLNLADSTASGDEPVDGQGPLGILNADGFRVADSGERIIFLGPARLTIFEASAPTQ